MNRKLNFILGIACTLLCGLSLSASAFSQTLPDDKGKAEFVHNCTACHGVDLVLAVKKTPEDWKKNVYEMASRGVDGTQEDIDNVVVYLDKYFSTETPVPADAHPAAPGGANSPQKISFVATAHSRRLRAATVPSLAHYLAAFPSVI
jgi:mono/diheme cytochrome c family protein